MLDRLLFFGEKFVRVLCSKMCNFHLKVHQIRLMTARYKYSVERQPVYS